MQRVSTVGTAGRRTGKLFSKFARICRPASQHSLRSNEGARTSKSSCTRWLQSSTNGGLPGSTLHLLYFQSTPQKEPYKSSTMICDFCSLIFMMCPTSIASMLVTGLASYSSNSSDHRGQRLAFSRNERFSHLRFSLGASLIFQCFTALFVVLYEFDNLLNVGKQWHDFEAPRIDMTIF